MPVHDWTCVDAGLFHDFHQTWTVMLCNALNGGVLPADHFALIEQKTPMKEPDVLTLQLASGADRPAEEGGGLAVAKAPPKTRLTRRSEASCYAAKANRITVRHRHGDVIAVVELVSPGNKNSKAEFRAFVEKSVAFIHARIHLLVIDLFPPTRQDPTFPPAKRFTLASYDAGPPQVAYVENIGVGDKLPDMPIFLRPEVYVPAPLEKTYLSAWGAFPRQLKGLLEKSPRKRK